MVSSLVDTISIKYYFNHSFTKSHDRGIIQKKIAPVGRVPIPLAIKIASFLGTIL